MGGGEEGGGGGDARGTLQGLREKKSHHEPIAQDRDIFVKKPGYLDSKLFSKNPPQKKHKIGEFRQISSLSFLKKSF